MNEEEMRNRIGVDSLNQVHYFLNQNDYGKACAYYFLHLEMFPSQLTECRDEFIGILHEWGKALDEQSRPREVITVYLHALRYYPDDLELLSSVGNYCIKYEYFKEAKKFFMAAYEKDKGSLEMEKNVFAWKETVFERWHFKMLNDKARNLAYKQAISQTLDRFQPHLIYDIGSGCGLLSLYAAQHPHSTKIIAIEEQEIQFETSQKLIKLNKDAEKILQMNIRSTDLKAEEIERGDMLITEIFDTGFFGEYVIPTLIHACENILEKNAKIIPCRVDVYISGINCEEFMRHHMILPNNPILNGKGSLFFMTQNQIDPYEAEYVTEFKDVTYLTDPEKFTVILNDLDDLKRIYTNMDNALEELEYVVKESGILHAFVVWFDLFLTEDIRITTNPHSSDCLKCWEQAVIFLDKPFEIKKDQYLKIMHSCHMSRLVVEIPEGFYEETPASYYTLSNLKTLLLNDEVITSNLELVLKKLKTSEDFVIVDLSTTPLLGIIANKFVTAECFLSCYDDKPAVEKLCELNNLDTNKINICDETSIEKLLLLDEFVDLLVLDPISSHGMIDVDQIYKYQELKRCLKPNALIIPQKVTLFVELIESDFVEDMTIVKETNLCGVKGADLLNEFRVPEICDIDSKKCNLKKLSDPLETVDIICDFEEELVSHHEIEVISDGDAIGVLYWFQVNYMEDIAFNTINCSSYKEALFLFDKKLHVSPGGKVKLRVKRHKGLLRFYLDN